MLNFTTDQSKSLLTLLTTAVKKSGKSDDSLVYTVKLATQITTGDEADCIDAVLPGSRSMFDRLLDTEQKQKMDTGPIDLTGNLQLIETDSGVSILDCAVEVSKIRLVKGAKVFTSDVEITVRGLDSTAASHFAAHLGSKLEARWEKGSDGQLDLFPSVDAPDDNSAYRILSIKTGEDDYVFGRQTGVDGNNVIVDDFGDTFDAPSGDVLNSIIVVSGDEDEYTLINAVDDFTEALKDTDADPSWQYVIIALSAGMADEMMTSAPKKVTRDVIKRAVDVALADVGAAAPDVADQSASQTGDGEGSSAPA